MFLVTWHSSCRGFRFWHTQYREESFSRMLASLPIIIAFLIAVGIPPVRLSRKFIKIHWWDYALPAIGLPVWIFLTFAEIGETASLSNMVIEVIIVLGISVVIPWARYMILYSNKNFAVVIYQIMYLIPFVATLLVRLYMPTLPE